MARREVICADALTFLRNLEDGGLPGSVCTSLPDITDVRLGVHAYKQFFVETVELILRKLKSGEIALFYQTDCRVPWSSDGSVPFDTYKEVSGSKKVGSGSWEWVDKSFLVQLACHNLGDTSTRLLFHKVCASPRARVAAFSDSFVGRVPGSGYSHLICVAKGAIQERAGAQSW